MGLSVCFEAKIREKSPDHPTIAPIELLFFLKVKKIYFSLFQFSVFIVFKLGKSCYYGIGVGPLIFHLTVIGLLGYIRILNLP